jgi:Fur family transcriptional regulator, peroxide stress response regulator
MIISRKASSALKRGKGAKNSQSRLEQMLSKLEDHGFRITPQRIAVLKILAVSENHPSVEMIYEKVRRDFPTTSLATIYKTVTLLIKLNEVLELGFPEGSNRYDGHKPYPHPHVICTKCRKIIDPDLERLNDLKQELVSETGFRITSHRLDFFGLCPDCQG